MSFHVKGRRLRKKTAIKLSAPLEARPFKDVSNSVLFMTPNTLATICARGEWETDTGKTKICLTGIRFLENRPQKICLVVGQCPSMYSLPRYNISNEWERARKNNKLFFIHIGDLNGFGTVEPSSKILGTNKFFSALLKCLLECIFPLFSSRINEVFHCCVCTWLSLFHYHSPWLTQHSLQPWKTGG